MRHEATSSNAPLAYVKSWIGPSTVPMIAGFAGGVASTSLLLPLDIVKLRLQVTESANPQRRFRFFRILGGIVKYEGIRGLYQGWTPAVLGSAASWGGYFYFYEKLKRMLIEHRESGVLRPHDVLSSTEMESGRIASREGTAVVLTSFDNFTLACMAGAVMVAITNPIWLVKTRMQLQMKRASEQHNIKPYNSMLDTFRTIIREEGAFALYKGSGPAMLLTSHGGVQFVVYEYLRKHYASSRAKRNRDAELNMSVWQRLQLSGGYLAMGAVAKLYVQE
jgi:solute carrier family 25 (mitochondrial folate transporter), member 32